MKETIEKGINQQINMELQSAYAYLAMANYAQEHDFPGASSWFKKQAEEEIEHAMKFLNYKHEVDGKVELMPLEAPSKNFASLEEAFKASLNQEHKVTKAIHKLYDLALKEKDHAFKVFLDWFIEEQVEEEASIKGILAKFKLAENSGAALLAIDKELCKRK